MQGASDHPRCLFAYETRQLKSLLDRDRIRWLIWSYLAENLGIPEN